MGNRVKEFRTKAGLSWTDLAQRAGVRARDIQRIENEKQAAALPHAKAICEALGKSLNVVFPGSQSIVNTLEADPRHASDLYEKLRHTGIEADPRVWIFKVILRGHKEPLFFNVSAAEQARLFKVIQDERNMQDEESFVVFDAHNSVVAINLRRLSFCHFLWEPGWWKNDDSSAEQDQVTRDDAWPGVRLYLNENETPLTFDAEPENSAPEKGDIGELAYIFDMLQDGCPSSDRFRIEDADGEDAFIRAGDIALLEVPNFILDQDEPDAINDDEDDDADDQDSPPPPRGGGLSLVPPQSSNIHT